nr:hypothetical protein [Tanacetum cinerariifolium]
MLFGACFIDGNYNSSTNRTQRKCEINQDMPLLYGVTIRKTYQAEEEPANFALMAIPSLSSSDNEDNIIVLKNEVEARENYIITFKQKLSQAETERDDLKLKFNKFQTSSKSLTELLANQTNGKHGLGYSSLENDSKSVSLSCPSDRVQPSGGYNVVPPPITRNFMPPKPNLVFHTTPIAVETDHLAFTIQLSPAKPAEDLSHTNRPFAPIIEEWVFDSETTAPQIAYSSVQSTKQVTPPRHSVQPVEAPILADTPNPTSPKTSSSSKRKNRKTCFVCRSVDHLIKDCNYHAMKKAQPTPMNYVHRGTHKQNASFTHHHPQMHMVPAAVLTQHLTRGQSPKISNSPPRVTAAQASVVSAAKEEEPVNFALMAIPSSSSSDNELSPAKPAEDLSHINRPSTPIIKEWVFDSETTAPQLLIVLFSPLMLTQSKPIFAVVRPICADVPKIMMTRPRHAHSIDTKSKSTFQRHLTRGQSPKISNSPPRVTVTPWIQEISDKFTHLKSLSIRNMVVFVSDLQLLAGTLGHNLRSLEIRGCKMISEDGLVDIARYCKDLRSLRLDGNDIDRDVNGKWLHELALEVFNHSKKLDHFGYGIINKDWDYSGFEFPQKIRGLHISNEALECVGTHLKNLHELRIVLGEEEGITTLDNRVRDMLMGCKKLEKLDMNLFPCGLTDVGLGYIGEYGHNLRNLSLSYTGGSDDKGDAGYHGVLTRLMVFDEVFEIFKSQDQVVAP